MIKQILISALLISCFVSCKKECNSTIKVGFYYLDSLTESDERISYKLYIDNVYVGELPTMAYKPSCGDVGMLYSTVNGKKHDIDVKNAADEFVSSSYLQVSENRLSTGSGKNCDRTVGDFSSGCECSAKTGDDCVTFGFFK